MLHWSFGGDRYSYNPIQHPKLTKNKLSFSNKNGLSLSNHHFCSLSHLLSFREWKLGEQKSIEEDFTYYCICCQLVSVHHFSSNKLKWIHFGDIFPCSCIETYQFAAADRSYGFQYQSFRIFHAGSLAANSSICIHLCPKPSSLPSLLFEFIQRPHFTTFYAHSSHFANAVHCWYSKICQIILDRSRPVLDKLGPFPIVIYRKLSSKKLTVSRQSLQSEVVLGFVLFEAVIWWHLRSSLISWKHKTRSSPLEISREQLRWSQWKKRPLVFAGNGQKVTCAPQRCENEGLALSLKIFSKSESPSWTTKTTCKVWRLRSNDDFFEWHEKLGSLWPFLTPHSKQTNASKSTKINNL